MNSCRTCLRQDIGDRGHDLFTPVARPMTKLLADSTALQIRQDDGLPASICSGCYSILTAFHAFCRRAIDTDHMYRKNCFVKCELLADDNININKNCAHENISPELPSVPAAAALPPPSIKIESACPTEMDHQQHQAYGDDVDNRTDNVNSADDNVENSDSVSDFATKSKRNDRSNRKRLYQPRPGGRCVDKSNRYTCDMCGKIYYEKVRLAGHLRQHCGLRPFPCDICPKQYDMYCKLLVHQRTHLPPEPDKPTLCPHEGCGKTFRLPRFAQDHYERIHRGLRPKVRVQCICDQCGKSFNTRSNLLQHRKSHINVEQYPYQCEVCEKRFLAKNGYTLHMLRHKDIRNFPCPLCPSRMVSQLELNYHVAKHDKSASWPCTQCTMTFERKSTLRRHEMREHRGYKPYVCSICGQEFSMELSLLNHERLHAVEPGAADVPQQALH